MQGCRWKPEPELDVLLRLIGKGKQLCMGKSFWRVGIEDNCLQIWKSRT